MLFKIILGTYIAWYLQKWLAGSRWTSRLNRLHTANVPIEIFCTILEYFYNMYLAVCIVMHKQIMQHLIIGSLRMNYWVEWLWLRICLRHIRISRTMFGLIVRAYNWQIRLKLAYIQILQTCRRNHNSTSRYMCAQIINQCPYRANYIAIYEFVSNNNVILYYIAQVHSYAWHSLTIWNNWFIYNLYDFNDTYHMYACPTL